MNLIVTSFFTQNLFYTQDFWFHSNAGFLDRYENGDWVPYVFLIDCRAIWSVDNDHFLLKQNNKTLLYEGGKLVKCSKDILSELEAVATAVKMGSWDVKYISDDKQGDMYKLTSTERGEQLTFDATSTLIGVLGDSFYFRQLRPRPFKIIKRDKKGNLLKEFEVGNCSFANLKNCFAALDRDKQEIFLFDLEAFSIIDSIKCAHSSAYSLFYRGRAKGVDFVTCDGKVLTWDGKKLMWAFDGKDVCSVHVKDDFVYISFDGGHLFSYDIDLAKVTGQKKFLDDYRINGLFSHMDLNFASVTKQDIFNDSEAGQYLASWTDEEFFSDNWEVQFELSICEKQRITAKGDDFNMLISVNKHKNFAVVARQSMAALDDVIRGYGVGRQEPISKNFTGKVTLCYKDAKYIKKQQRSQLEKAAKDLVEVKYSLYEGPATGEYCSVEVVFDD